MKTELKALARLTPEQHSDITKAVRLMNKEATAIIQLADEGLSTPQDAIDILDTEQLGYLYTFAKYLGDPGGEENSFTWAEAIKPVLDKRLSEANSQSV